MVTPQSESLHDALSAVMDGGATAAEWARVEAAWAGDPELRERWAEWHAVGDGIRSTDLLTCHRPPHAVLAVLHARQSSDAPQGAGRHGWLAPFAVAAGFVVVAVGLVTLSPPASRGPQLVVASAGTLADQGLAGTSFAQAAAGRTLPSLEVPGGATVLVDGASPIPGWEASLPPVPAALPPRDAPRR